MWDTSPPLKTPRRYRKRSAIGSHEIEAQLEVAAVFEGGGDLVGGSQEVRENVLSEGLRGGAGGVGGDVEGSDDTAAGVVDGSGERAQAELQLLVDQCVAVTTGSLDN